jgi:manganese oxidase
MPKSFTTLIAIFVLVSCSLSTNRAVAKTPDLPIAKGMVCENEIKARVVALEAEYIYNRFGSYNPGGMMYALRRDVVISNENGENENIGNDGKPVELSKEKAHDIKFAGYVKLREGKRPRPLILRVNEGDCLTVEFTNLLDPLRESDGIDQEQITDPETGAVAFVETEKPATRYASMHVNGLDYVGSIASDGGNVGYNPSSLAAPGETRIYKWYAKKEGSYLFFSTAAPAGGEGDGGQLGLGLFGSVNVEPRNSVWFRSQVTGAQLAQVTRRLNPNGTPVIDYKPNYATGFGLEPAHDGSPGGQEPILAMLNRNNELVHSDINAVIAFARDFDSTAKGEDCSLIKGYGSSCGAAFREFTTIFHDELTAVQAFRDLEREDLPIHKLKDGMGINYGSAGLGAMVLANRGKKGPAAGCVECKLEEFFLSSWVMGDPAMVVEKDENLHAFKAKYPDDPSNVHHSYLGDPVRFRNMHAGPKETHVFHLHAHQWVQDWHDPESVYLDSQTISPGSSFTYEIHYSGSGNRNLTPGDSIFHCHLYPHFAQGMWELWRTHDVFENGGQERNLPDAEIAGGTPTPALVPLPNSAMAPMPTPDFKGYPFYVAGVPGHRPPQPPLDLDPDSYAGGLAPDTLRRHVILGGERLVKEAAVEPYYLNPTLAGFDPNLVSSTIAKRVVGENPDPALLDLAARLTSANIEMLPHDGTATEKKAMDFHAGAFPGAISMLSDYGFPSAAYPSFDSFGNSQDPVTHKPILFKVNGLKPQPGAPFADPCPTKYFLGPQDKKNDQTYWHILAKPREYKAAYVQFDMTVNKAGWHDPQARIIVLEDDVKDTLEYRRPAEPLFFRANSGECVVFKATNLIPSNLNVDDFQIFSPTDEIGQHIHLVKFDVTSSDGSANGWNYEDATLSPEEIRERIAANNLFQKETGGNKFLTPKTHRIFMNGGVMAGDARGTCPVPPADLTDDAYVEELKKHPWCGAQTTIQRWWADPLLDSKVIAGPDSYHDRTIRTVFTHDHLGPSSHQHHGLYAALVIEPAGSTWQTANGQPMGGVGADGNQIVQRQDGGPTSYAANIVDPRHPTDSIRNKREYGLAFADFSILYTKKIETKSDPLSPGNFPVNAANRVDFELPQAVLHSSVPAPEAISSSDPGSQLLNYRNEPIALRVGKSKSSPFPSYYEQRKSTDPNPACEARAMATEQLCKNAGDDTAACVRHLCDAGDLANAFSSLTHGWQDDASFRDPKFLTIPEPGGLRQDGDPGTPILGAYEGDRVQLRLIQGAQEENHVFTMQGMKWLSEPDSPNSGYRNGQHIGISEHFEFNVDAIERENNSSIDHLFASSAVDNLWDGQWGLLRVLPKNDVSHPSLARLPSNPAGDVSIGSRKVCPPNPPRRFFEIVALPVQDWVKGEALVYNKKANIIDSNGIIFVKIWESKLGHSTPADQPVIDKILDDLKTGKRRPEPLILRASAGECIEVSLTSKLPQTRQEMKDGPTQVASWSYNLLPPITEGFNFNQIQESNRVGLYPELLGINLLGQGGSNVGSNIDSTVPNRNGTDGSLQTSVDYQWYAGDIATQQPVEFGVAALTDMGDVIKHGSHGAVGAIVIEPEGAKWTTDCEIKKADLPVEDAECLEAAATVTYDGYLTDQNGNPLDDHNNPVVDASGKFISGRIPAKKPQMFREFVAILQNDVSAQQAREVTCPGGDTSQTCYSGWPMFNLRNGDDSEDSGQKAINYRTEPLWFRLAAVPEADPGEMSNFDYKDVYSSKVHGDPDTPLFTAKAGIPLRVRVVEPSGHPRNHGFSVFGHDWPAVPAAANWRKDGNGNWIQVTSGRLDSKVLKVPGVTSPDSTDRYAGNRVGTINGIGPARHIDAVIESAGGKFSIPGDYLYRTHEGFTSSGGMWGLMRVIPAASCQAIAGAADHSVFKDPNTNKTVVCN